jgi:hypothetical protein
MHHQGNQFNHQSNVTSTGTNQNEFVDGARTRASCTCCCTDLLPQSGQRSPPRPTSICLGGDLGEGEVEVGLGHPWPDPGGLHLLPHGVAPLLRSTSDGARIGRRRRSSPRTRLKQGSSDEAQEDGWEQGGSYRMAPSARPCEAPEGAGSCLRRRQDMKGG